MRRARESEASRGDEKKFTNSSHHDALWRMFDENFSSGSIAIEVKEATLEDVEVSERGCTCCKVLQGRSIFLRVDTMGGACDLNV